MNVPQNLPEWLALLNACLNSASGILMVLAVMAVKKGNVQKHRALMLSAVGTSAAFLVSYGTRMSIAGDTVFQGEGAIRTVYFAVLISHVVLAIVVLPMVIRALYLGLENEVAKHRRLVRFTFPIWLYVSVTGVIVYLMLYQFPTG